MPTGLRRPKTFEDLLDHWPAKPRKPIKGGYLVLGQCHADTNPSVEVKHSASPNKIANIRCYAGCSIDAVLKSVKLTMADLYLDDRGNGRKPGALKSRKAKSEETWEQLQARREKTYGYVGADGKLLHQTVRYKDPKDFRQRRPGPNFVTGENDNEWIWDLEGVELQLRHLPDILTAKRNGELIFLPEGERDDETLNGLGLVATTASLGANKPILQQYLDTLAGAHVRKIGDNDEEGQRDALAWCRALYPIAASLKLLTLPAEVKDSTAWVESGAHREDFEELERSTPLWVPPVDLEPAEDDPHKYNLTDLGNAERFVKQWGGSVRYCKERKQYIAWSGKYWDWNCDIAIERMMSITARRIYHEAAEETDEKRREAIEKHAKTSEKMERVTGSIKAVRSQPGIAITISELDTDPMLLNVCNGTIDLTTGDLRPHDKRDFITKMIDVYYDPPAYSPSWIQFIERTYADEKEAHYLQKWCGYCISGKNNEQQILFHWGKGEEGKTTLTQVMLGLLGPYGYQAEAETFMLSKTPGQPGRARPDLIAFQGKRLVVANELEQGRKLAVNIIKTLTGGEKNTARGLYKDPENWKQTAARTKMPVPERLKE